MESYIISFIKKHFGCYIIDGNSRVLNSIGTMSIVPVEEINNVFHGDAEAYFTIKPSESNGEIVLFLNKDIKLMIEKELGLQ